MSTPTDLENRITAALAARAEQVRPEHLEPTLAPVVPLRRRTPLIVLAAACVLLAIGLTLWLPKGEDRAEPAPEPDGTEMVIPPDVGRGWVRAQMSPPAQLDLDGDGKDEKVRFLAEPGRDFDGRVRLESTLSSDGSSVYGVVDLGSTIGVNALEPVDADGDGDEELVLYHSPDEMTTIPVVLDLRDTVLVEATPTEPDLLRRGTTTEPGGTERYDIVRLHDYWIEDGTLFSGRSVSTFASTGMSLYRPENYVVDAVAWRLGEDETLVPEPAASPCMVESFDSRRPCSTGELDDLPVVAPVASGRIGIGEGFSVDTGYRFDARVEAEPGAGGAIVVEGEDGRTLRTPINLGADSRVFTTPPTSVYDGASLLVASEESDEASSMQVLVQDGDDLVVLEPVGGTPFGTGRADDQRVFRTWLTANGEVFTAVADTEDESGSWKVWSWVMDGPRTMAAVPRATMCFPDPTDPATGGRC